MADSSNLLSSGFSALASDAGKSKAAGGADLAAFRNGVVNRNATLSTAIWERDTEIKRRTAASGTGRG
jgi:hypothetical protein